MKRYVLWAILAAFLAVGPVGCGKRQIEELNAKVTQLQTDIASAKEQITDKTKEADDLRAKVSQLQATANAQAADIVKIKAERDKLRHEVAVLKKKKR